MRGFEFKLQPTARKKLCDVGCLLNTLPNCGRWENIPEITAHITCGLRRICWVNSIHLQYRSLEEGGFGSSDITTNPRFRVQDRQNLLWEKQTGVEQPTAKLPLTLQTWTGLLLWKNKPKRASTSSELCWIRRHGHRFPHLIEAFRPGHIYIRIQLTDSDVPCEMVENFDPIYPIIVGQVSYLLKNVSDLSQVPIKRHRWYSRTLTNNYPSLISLGFGDDSKASESIILLTTPPSSCEWLNIHRNTSIGTLLSMVQFLYPTPVSVLLIHYLQIHPGFGLLLLV